MHEFACLVRALSLEKSSFVDDSVVEKVKATLGFRTGDRVVFFGEDLFQALGPANNITVRQVRAEDFGHWVVRDRGAVTGGDYDFGGSICDTKRTVVTSWLLSRALSSWTCGR